MTESNAYTNEKNNYQTSNRKELSQIDESPIKIHQLVSNNCERLLNAFLQLGYRQRNPFLTPLLNMSLQVLAYVIKQENEIHIMQTEKKVKLFSTEVLYVENLKKCV